MTTYYSEFCTALPIDNDAQKEWLIAHHNFFDTERTEEECEAFCKRFDIDDECEWGDGVFGLRFENGMAIMAGDESCRAYESAATLIHEFLKWFRPEGCHGYEFCHSASRAHTDAFGGGAVFITAKEIKWLFTNQWLEEQHEAFAKIGSEEQ